MTKFVWILSLSVSLQSWGANTLDYCKVIDLVASTPVETAHGIVARAKLRFFEGEFGEPDLDVGSVRYRAEDGDRVVPEAALVIDSNWSFHKDGSPHYYFLNINKSAGSPHHARLFRGNVKDYPRGEKTLVAKLICQ